MASGRSKPRVQIVNSKYIQKLFNEGRYAERQQAGEFAAVVVKDRHPSAPKAPVPICTRSQLILYKDQRRRTVAIVHQYLTPSGKLGASGKPDPKQLWHDGVLYQVL
jgi:hypothetical protein